jgi:S-DNA-T family DNA segregation ATPase FtsK/SpoIIIE
LSPRPSGPRSTSSPRACATCSGYRAAFRCTSSGSSNIILGDGWSEAGFSATDLSNINPGLAYLIAEGGVPRRIKAAWLSNSEITQIVDYAAWTRQAPAPVTTLPTAASVA